MNITFDEIKEKILAVYPEAKVTQRLYDYDYFASIWVRLGDDWYSFVQRREPIKAEPAGAEPGEMATYYQGFKPNEYPEEMVQLILITLVNKIQILHKYTGAVEVLQ